MIIFNTKNKKNEIFLQAFEEIEIGDSLKMVNRKMNKYSLTSKWVASKMLSDKISQDVYLWIIPTNNTKGHKMYIEVIFTNNEVVNKTRVGF